MTQRLTVPSLYSPFTPAIHPQHAVIDRSTAGWAEKFDIGSPELRSRLVTHEIGTFASRILPEGNEDVVGILSDLVLWLFGVDDGHCEEGELGGEPGDLVAELSRLTWVAQNPDAPMMHNDPLAEGVRDLRRRISVHASPSQVVCWVNALREYFMSVVWEAAHRRSGTVPSLNDYTLKRLYTGAANVVLPMMEFGYGYELRPEERNDVRVRALAEMTYFIIGWDNDIFSFHKESRGGHYYLNVLKVLQHEYGISAEEALHTAIAQRDRVTTLFLAVRDQVTPTAGPELRQYVDSFASCIRATQDWCVSSVRYTTPDDPAGLPFTFHDRPTDTSREPLPIPAVAWWWDLLPA